MTQDRNDEYGYYRHDKKPERLAPTDIRDDERFVIGMIGDRTYFTNIAVDHETGRMTNARLMAMTDEELTAMAFAEPITRDGIRTELYRRPRNAKVAEAQASAADAGKTYGAPCRAVCILEFRQQQDASRRTEYGKQIDAARTTKELREIAGRVMADRATRSTTAEKVRKYAEHRIREIEQKEAADALSTATR